MRPQIPRGAPYQLEVLLGCASAMHCIPNLGRAALLYTPRLCAVGTPEVLNNGHFSVCLAFD